MNFIDDGTPSTDYTISETILIRAQPKALYTNEQFSALVKLPQLTNNLGLTNTKFMEDLLYFTE